MDTDALLQTQSITTRHMSCHTVCSSRGMPLLKCDDEWPPMMSAKQSQLYNIFCATTNIVPNNVIGIIYDSCSATAVSDGAGMNLCSRQPEDDTLKLPSGTEIEVKPPESCLWPNAMQVCQNHPPTVHKFPSFLLCWSSSRVHTRRCHSVMMKPFKSPLLPVH